MTATVIVVGVLAGAAAGFGCVIFRVPGIAAPFIGAITAMLAMLIILGAS